MKGCEIKMSYSYNEQTGEKYIDLNKGYITCEGWCPYYNLKGKYVGTKINSFPGPGYYNPSIKRCVKNYEELDW